MTELRETEHSFKTWDGVDLFYRAWQPPTGAKKAWILFHRGHEHSGRFNEVVEKLNTETFPFSPGTPGATDVPPATGVTREASPCW